jgi:hypothetical protein
MIMKNAFECPSRFQMKVHMLISKVVQYTVNLYLLHLTPNFTFVFKLTILIHNYFCHINDFTIHLWHLNRGHKIAKNEPTYLATTQIDVDSMKSIQIIEDTKNHKNKG